MRADRVDNDGTPEVMSSRETKLDRAFQVRRVGYAHWDEDHAERQRVIRQN